MEGNNKSNLSEVEKLKSEIENLRFENRHLLQKMEDKLLGEKIRESIRMINMAAVIKSLQDHKDFLKLLLQMTKKVVGAEAASIILYDHKENELFFEEAVGEKAEEVKKFRLKSNEGIAGYCFTTGEALAVADVMKDSRFKREISESIHHKQKALMAAPLIYHQEIIGVMEAINKIDGGVFSAEDLETFTLIANFSAMFLRKSGLYCDLYSLFLIIFRHLVLDRNQESISARDFNNLSRKLEEERVLSAEYGEAIELSSLVEEISSHGKEEQNLARSILKSLNGYLKEKGQLHHDVAIDWMMD
ncbi:MAG: GAF domain-containing protein [Candidatus Eremiobacteraeota bacterium]|nr:GAF domain-containing protein [Candidatus Eremiobacteraeota bacterium]